MAGRSVETVPQIVSRVLALAALFLTLIFFLPAVPAIPGGSAGVSAERGLSGALARQTGGDRERIEPSRQKTPQTAQRIETPDHHHERVSLSSPPHRTTVASPRPPPTPAPAWSSWVADLGGFTVRARPRKPRGPPPVA